MTLRVTTWAIVVLVSFATVAAQDPPVRFVEASREAGVVFHHISGASPDKFLMETMGGGAVFFDYDGDGWVDLFLVDGGSVANPALAKRARHRLFRNDGDGTFTDVSNRAGIHHREYGMGACAGDYDGDGRTDLYVTNHGPNTLYRNRGDGSFTDVTAAARVGDARWSASCAFADLDRDGDLDLWVTNYVDANRTASPFCGDAQKARRFYCHPLKFNPLPNTLYRNDGDRTFSDYSAESGVGALRANGLGVVVTDYDADGWPDVFVANDTMPNFLFRNRRELKFEEAGLMAGFAVPADGRSRAGMGIDAGDYDADGQLDLVVTNLDFEMHSLHRGLGRGLFAYASTESGIGYPTLPFVGFGVAFLDFDNDGHLDIAMANGHVLDNAPQSRSGATYAQRKLLFRNVKTRRFVEVGKAAGPGFALEKVGRGLAVGDIDNDGDLDLLVANNGQTADLLRNDGGNRGNALTLQLVGTAPNTGAIGTVVRAVTGTRTQQREVRAGSSYLSQHDPRVHVGLGAATVVDRVDIRWPTGAVETLRDLPANQIVTVAQGKGIVNRTPYVGR